MMSKNYNAYLGLIHELFEFNRKWAETLLGLEAQERIMASVDEAMARLGEQERDVLRRHFGLDEEQQTLEAIGVTFGFNKERIRQIKAKALRKLGHPIHAYPMQEWLAKFDVADPPNPLHDPARLTELKAKVRSGTALTNEELGTILIDDLELSVRSLNTFKNDNVVTLLDVENLSRRALLWTPNFGEKSLREVEETFALFGVVLSD